MLYNAENIMTPKLRLREQARNTLLSWILKLRLPGRARIITSTYIMEAPATHAEQRGNDKISQPERDTKSSYTLEENGPRSVLRITYQCR